MVVGDVPMAAGIFLCNLHENMHDSIGTLSLIVDIFRLSVYNKITCYCSLSDVYSTEVDDGRRLCNCKRNR